MYLNMNELSGNYYIIVILLCIQIKGVLKLKIYDYSWFKFRWFILHYRNFRVIKLKNCNHKLYMCMYIILVYSINYITTSTLIIHQYKTFLLPQI